MLGVCKGGGGGEGEDKATPQCNAPQPFFVFATRLQHEVAMFPSHVGRLGAFPYAPLWSDV